MKYRFVKIENLDGYSWWIMKYEWVYFPFFKTWSKEICLAACELNAKLNATENHLWFAETRAKEKWARFKQFNSKENTTIIEEVEF